MPLYNTVTPSVSGNQSYQTPGALAETNHRYGVSGSSQPTSGALILLSIGLQIGQSVGHIGFCTGTTPTTLASHWWTTLVDQNFVQQAHSADQTTTNLAASTWYNLAMVTPYVATYTGNYFLGLMIAVSGGSVASIMSPTFTPATQMITGANVPTPVYGGVSSTGLTTPGTDGTTTYIAPTAVVPCYYMYCSA